MPFGKVSAYMVMSIVVVRSCRIEFGGWCLCMRRHDGRRVLCCGVMAGRVYMPVDQTVPAVGIFIDVRVSGHEGVTPSLVCYRHR